MNILLVAATEAEISDLRKLRFAQHELTFLVTGIGMTATALGLGRALALRTYDLCINAGLAGSFNPSYPPGTVVNVTEDLISELGAEDDTRFLRLEEMGLPGIDRVVNSAYPAVPSVSTLPAVRGITVNTVHGNEESIRKIRLRFNPDTESMEGAAFLLACRSSSVPCLQLRAISNRVEKRNRDAWDIPGALKSLNECIAAILSQL